MLDRYTVSKNPPREIDKIPLIGGLRLTLNMGIAVMVLGTLAGTSGFIAAPGTAMSFGMLGFGILVVGIGYYIYRGAQAVMLKRADALSNGMIIEGEVISKGRKYNPFSSWRYYTVIVSFEGEEHQLVSTSETLHNYFEEGDPAMGFKNPETGNLFFPPEAGIRIDVVEG